MRNSRWLRLLAYVSGSVNQELLLRNEYLAAENRILRTKLPRRLRLSNPERVTLSEIGKRLGRKALHEVACVAKPDTILAWYRRLVAQKFDGSKHRQYPGRPPVSSEIEALVVRMARENSGWGYDRIVGALANLGHHISDQTVGNILRRNGITPAPKRSQITTWKDFLAAHMNVLAGCDFFTVEVLTWRGLVTYYVLFFLHLESRRVRRQVLCLVSVRAGIGRCEDHSTAGSKPELKRVRGTMGPLGQTGMPVQIDLVRRGSAFTRPDGVHPTLSRRKKPSRERQPTALSRFEQQTTPTESRD